MQFYLRQVIGAKQVVDTNTILKWDFVKTFVKVRGDGMDAPSNFSTVSLCGTPDRPPCRALFGQGL